MTLRKSGMKEKEFIEKLRKLCIKYDQKHGQWPESGWERFSVYEFVLDEFGLGLLNWPEGEVRDPQIYEKYEIEVEGKE